MLKNDTLKNGTSRTGLYGSAPPGPERLCSAGNDVGCGDLVNHTSVSVSQTISISETMQYL